MHDKELASRRIRMHCSRHRENARIMCKVIAETVLRKLALDRVSQASHTCPVRASALDHKAADYTVKDQPVIESLFTREIKFFTVFGAVSG